MSLPVYNTAMVRTRGKLVVGCPRTTATTAATLWPKEDWTMALKPVLNPVFSSYYGHGDDSLDDITALVSFTPKSLAGDDALIALIPSMFRSGTPGTRLQYPTSINQPLKCWASNGDLYSFVNGWCTKPPTLTLGGGQDVFGPAEFTAICDQTLLPGASNAFFAAGAFPQTAQADPADALSLTDFSRCRWTGNFAVSGTDYTNVDGFANFEPEVAFIVEFHQSPKAELVQKLTRNWYVDVDSISAGITVKVQPIGPTMAQVHAARGAVHNMVQGARINSGTGASQIWGRLTLTPDVAPGGVTSLVLEKCYISECSDVFGKGLRCGPITFQSAPNADAALLTINGNA